MAATRTGSAEPAGTHTTSALWSILRRRISGLDNVFLLAEQPEQLMAIAGCWRFAVPPKADEVRATFQRLVDTFPRFQQRARSVFGGFGYWEDVPSMNVADHIVRIPLHGEEAEGAYETEEDEARLKLVLGDLLSQPLDRAKPLWMVYDIQGFADGSSALFVKIHHCIADGQGSIRAVLTMASSEGADLRQMQYGQAEKQLRELEQASNTNPGGETNTRRKKSGGSKVAALAQTAVKLVMLLVGAIYVYLQFVGVAFHRKRSMKGRLTTKKAVTWSKPVSLDDVKLIKNVFGVTVNDVLVSALTAAFRSYLLETDQLLEKDLLTAIPVSLRSLDDWEMGNKVCTVWLYFPVSEEDPVARLRTVHDRMNRLKTLPAAPIQYFNTRLLGAIPGLLNNPLVLRHFKWWLAKAHCVMTNVPGPKVPLIMAGQKITSYIGFVPQSGDGGVGVALISYCDQVMLSVQSDVGQLVTTTSAGAGVKQVVPLEEAFFAEVQHLKALAQAKAAAAAIAAADAAAASSAAASDGPLTTQETKKAK